MMRYNREIQQMYFLAFRYALGRKTYVVDEVIEYIKNAQHYLDVDIKEKMKQEILDCRDYGMEQDKKQWLELASIL